MQDISTLLENKYTLHQTNSNLIEGLSITQKIGKQELIQEGTIMDDTYMNILYDAALEFGANWRRPLVELANERLPNLNQSDCEELCFLVERAREGIEKYIENHYEFEKGLTVPEEEVILWIKQNYPWLSDKNISHGMSQGLYYAWHG